MFELFVILSYGSSGFPNGRSIHAKTEMCVGWIVDMVFVTYCARSVHYVQ